MPSLFVYMVKICLEIYELMPVLHGTKCIWKKKSTKHNKSCLQDEACLDIKTKSPKGSYDTSMHMFNRSQNIGTQGVQE